MGLKTVEPPALLCSICKGREYLFNDGAVSPCACLLRKRQDAFAQRVIPARFRGGRVSNLQPSAKATISIDRQLKVITMIQQDPLGGYAFLGPTGVGKSHLLYTLANEAIYQGKHVIAATCADIVKSARDAEFNKEQPAIIDGLDKYAQASVFIDEMDKIKLSEYTQLLLFNLVNKAYDNPNIITLSITSNLPPSRFEDAYGAAFYRKLKEISRPIIYSA